MASSGGPERYLFSEQARGWLQAIDATTGKLRWKRQWPTPLVAGVTATSGGMLFTGDLNDDFLAIDASNGKTLYHFNTGGSIGGGVISYEIAGKQYVATTSGVVGVLRRKRHVGDHYLFPALAARLDAHRKEVSDWSPQA